MNDQMIELSVDVQTFNTIIAALDELPHKVSRRVIDELARQAQPQVQQQGGQMGGQPAGDIPQGPLSDKVIS
jgi:hypothetical protein